MKRSETMLVLGGGNGQMALLGSLRNRGIRIVLQDRDSKCPGRSLADEFVVADTTDDSAAGDSALRFRVDGVCTAGTDQPVLAASVAAAARGCPSPISPETALKVTDKEAMKAALQTQGIPVPQYRILGPDDISVESVSRAGLRFPLVVKPVDSQGQRGVLRVDESLHFELSCLEALKWSRRGRVIAEEYHPNSEITVSGWIHSGAVRIWTVTDRVTRDFPPSIGLCFAHRFPSTYGRGYAGEIANLTRRCVQALDIRNGPLYFQFLVTGNGLLVNECAARLGGAYEDISLPPVCGNDPVSLLIEASLRGKADPDLPEHRTTVTASVFAVPLMFCHPGRIHRLDGERAVKALPGVTAFEWLQKPGSVINPTRNSVQRAACMVVHAGDEMGVNRILKQAFQRLCILDDEGRQLLRNTLGYSRIPR